nr:PREDICTED: uncharacterized protein LOC100564551 isoform X2 [Anolis carolinensis]|eukprot:XP_008120657.1 PREDICTED: uncharacterized protein LOC100564551 isoform X2 [Anolis carolinensis]
MGIIYSSFWPEFSLGNPAGNIKGRPKDRIHSAASLFWSSKAERIILLEMSFHFVVMVLLSLHTAELVETSQSPQKLVQMLVSAGKSVTIECVSSVRENIQSFLTWYKEEQDQSLRKIDHHSQHSKPGLSPADAMALNIHHAQRNDSGVYYCAQIINGIFSIVSGTRLIVSDASSPSLSIFMPSFMEESQFNHSIPLLCLFFGTLPSQHAISSEIGGEMSHEDYKNVSVIDREGVISIWSLKLIPPAKWIPGMTYACSDQGNRNISAVIPMNLTSRANCAAILYVGIPCVVGLLTVLLVIALFWKHVFGGNVRKPANEMPMTPMPQTEYAELRSSG